MSALFKKGDRYDANNYRPITVLPTVSKILEKAVRIQLYAFLTDNGIITSKQFGFRPKLSTGTALAHFTDNILQNMDAGRFTGAVFLDLSKAFDMVDHQLLLQKLTNILALPPPPPSGLNLTSQIGHKSRQLEMLTPQLLKCPLGYPRAVSSARYFF